MFCLLKHIVSESISAVCEFFRRGACNKGSLCPYRHINGDRTIVCKHWLRGLCKKGDQCEFLHEYDMTKMPECYFYSRFSKYEFKLGNRRIMNFFQMLVIIRNALFFTLIQRVNLGIAHGMIEDFVGMARRAVIVMFGAFFVQIIWLDFVQMDLIANSCSEFLFWTTFSNN